MKRKTRTAFLSKRLHALERRIGQARLAKLMNVQPRSVRRYKAGTRSMGKGQRERLEVISKLYMTVKPTKSNRLQKQRFDKYSIITSPKFRYFKAEKSGDIHLKIKLSDPEELKKYGKVAQKLGMEWAYVSLVGMDDKGNPIRRFTYYTELDRPGDLLSGIEDTQDEYDFVVTTEMGYNAVLWAD